jgi:glycosyltransferase involved in cell wall biosynthesis
VALCTRNGASHLEQQLASIFAQTLLPDEIVVSDDASSDETVPIVRAAFDGAAGRRRPRLLLIQNPEPLGVTANFEQALRSCSSELIALCDQDDAWHENRLSAAVEVLDARPEIDLLYSDARLVDANGEPLGYSLFEALDVSPAEREAVSSGSGLGALLRRNLVTGATTIVRRELVQRAVPFPAPWVHDEWLAVVAATSGGLTFLAEQLIDYRQHGTNEIGVRKLNFMGRVNRVLEPRDGRNAYLLERSRVLLARLEQMGGEVSTKDLELVRGKVEHLRFRSTLQSRRVKRWRPVLREVATGRYALFGRGTGDILRDLFQPAGVSEGNDVTS